MDSKVTHSSLDKVASKAISRRSHSRADGNNHSPTSRAGRVSRAGKPNSPGKVSRVGNTNHRNRVSNSAPDRPTSSPNRVPDSLADRVSNPDRAVSNSPRKANSREDHSRADGGNLESNPSGPHNSKTDSRGNRTPNNSLNSSLDDTTFDIGDITEVTELPLSGFQNFFDDARASYEKDPASGIIR
ncbi:hypothetical protein M0R89_07095 [Halorussus limi]|uniref:Uncharacterized protein n=1 Tax=Halorussus limi TaxID=2938695 RepID=A0A8U0HYA4_9EURY|nr:hypothetical protein [Halorussus limi]UPV75819.1 hypothetical protein M0R89_07095 [Halorussus limi]